MAHTVPTSIPSVVRAGDTVTWRRTLTYFPAGDGWALSYVLVNAAGQITFSASAAGDDHLVEVPVATSTDWSAGKYRYQERISLSGKIYTISDGIIEVLPSFAAATSGLDARSHAQKTLEALEAWIEGRDLGVAEYEIAGRRLKTIPIPDLLKLRERYRNEVNRASGKSGRVYVRF